MVERVSKALMRAVGTTLEQMVFMEVLASVEACSRKAGDDVWAILDIHKPFSGRMGLVMPAELVNNILDGVFTEPPAFGEEPPEEPSFTDQQREDTVAELLNTVAGQLLALLVPEDNTFKLGVPERGSGDYPGLEQSDCYCFQAGEKEFCVEVRGDAFLTR